MRSTLGIRRNKTMGLILLFLPLLSLSLSGHAENLKTPKPQKNKIVPGVVFRKARVPPPLRSRPPRSVGPDSLIWKIQAVKTTSLRIRTITLCRLDIE